LPNIKEINKFSVLIAIESMPEIDNDIFDILKLPTLLFNKNTTMVTLLNLKVFKCNRDPPLKRNINGKIEEIR
jgi:hypothetical protein